MNISPSPRLPHRVWRKMGEELGICKYKRRIRMQFSRSELVNYLVRNNIHTVVQLNRLGKPGDPTIYYFLKEFTKWNNAHEAAFGAPLFKAEITKEYMMECVSKLGLDTWEKYRTARKNDPKIVPSHYHIYKYFKTLKRLRRAAYKHDIDRVLSESVKLRRRFGRKLTMYDYKNAGMEMDAIIKWFGGKEKWDKYVEWGFRRILKRKVAQ